MASDPSDSLKDITRLSRYAQYNRKEQRRETWEEQVKRVFRMHRVMYSEIIEKTPELGKYIDTAENAMFKQTVLGSQRALQFGGPAILRKHARIYNCAATYMNRMRAFQEVMWLLLCGCGVGISVQYHHVQKLPMIEPLRKYSKKRRSGGGFIELAPLTHVVEDSIEGWANALGVLLSSYFTSCQTFPKYFGRDIKFDYSNIRPKGAKISFMSGKAPGKEPLKKALAKIKNVIEGALRDGCVKLRTIDVFDIVMHSSDAVLAGGIRRSALLTIFSLDDELMMKAKTGSWFNENPQRARSNNSVLLLRNKTTKAQFKKIFTSTKQFGEPGFIWADNKETLFNPCVPASTWTMTSEGARQVKDLIKKPFMALVNGKQYKSGGFFKTGEKVPVYRIQTKEGYEVCATENHKFFTAAGKWVELQELKIGSTVMLHKHSHFEVDEKNNYFRMGVPLGRCYKATPPETKDEFMFIMAPGVEKQGMQIQAGFLRGLFDVIGLIQVSQTRKNSISLSSGIENLKHVQRMLLRFGIYSTIFTHCDFAELLLTDYNVYSYAKLIGFGHENKRNILNKVINSCKWNSLTSNHVATVSLIKLDSIQDVYDCEVDEVHAFDANGFYAHNCVEVSLYAHDPETKQSGSEMCNLSEINMKMINSKEDFLKACRAASILGTLQAGYTNFPYLGDATENIVRREALLGCSMTGMMDRPQYAFDATLQKQGAIEIKRINKIVAKLLGINPSARTTCVKPAGSTSCILGTASGIHPHHSSRYFRRIQCTKIDPISEFYAKYNPDAVEESVWSANKTDNVITTLIQTDADVLTKADVTAIDLLKKVRLTQKNWVTYGRDKKLCTQPFLNHNVSNTINVKPSEWEDVSEFIYENRFYFAGISLLSHSGDKDYNQAPFQAVYTELEISKKYGEAALFASGLIIHALQAFNGNLYAACACFLGHGEKLILPDIDPDDITNSMKKLKVIAEKKSWLMRASKFTTRYFGGNTKKMTYCLKDVDALKKWHDLNRTYKTVPWTELKEDTDATKPEQYVACGGGKCMIWKM